MDSLHHETEEGLGRGCGRRHRFKSLWPGQSPQLVSSAFEGIVELMSDSMRPKSFLAWLPVSTQLRPSPYVIHFTMLPPVSSLWEEMPELFSPAHCTHTQFSPPFTMAYKWCRTTGALKAATSGTNSTFPILFLMNVLQTVHGYAKARALLHTAPARHCLYRPVLLNLPVLCCTHIKPALGQHQDREPPISASCQCCRAPEADLPVPLVSVFPQG